VLGLRPAPEFEAWIERSDRRLSMQSLLPEITGAISS
jgi:hypothetical protein